MRRPSLSFELAQDHSGSIRIGVSSFPFILNLNWIISSVLRTSSSSPTPCSPLSTCQNSSFSRFELDEYEPPYLLAEIYPEGSVLHQARSIFLSQGYRRGRLVQKTATYIFPELAPVQKDYISELFEFLRPPAFKKTKRPILKEILYWKGSISIFMILSETFIPCPSAPF